MSTNRTDAIQISRRYATALFALATEAKKEQALVGELAVLAKAINESAELKDALANPLVTNIQKTNVLKALMAKGDALSLQAITIIAREGRASLIPEIARQLHSMLTEQQGEVEATITSARALPAATQKQLLQSLTKATGKKVQLKLVENPEVLGGLMVELGSLRLDATLSGALSTMREQLLAPTH